VPIGIFATAKKKAKEIFSNRKKIGEKWKTSSALDRGFKCLNPINSGNNNQFFNQLSREQDLLLELLSTPVIPL